MNLTAERPDLFNWSRFLTPAGPVELAEQTLIDRYINMDHRFQLSPTRRHAFELMAVAGWRVIPHCLAADIPVGWEEVVVYLSDRGGHAGRDKIKLQSAEARALHPGLLCSRYVGAETPGISFRVLRVGMLNLLGIMRSADDWRSNCGTVSVEWGQPETVARDWPHLLTGPVWSVDLVDGYALDFNSSPGLDGVPLGQLDAPALIEAWARQVGA